MNKRIVKLHPPIELVNLTWSEIIIIKLLQLIKGASRSFKRSRSNFISPLLSKRTKTSDVVPQKLSFNSDPVATTSTNDDSSVIVSTETVGSDVSQSDKCTELSATDTSHLMKRKMELQCTLAEKQEKLRKLRMVKLYRSKVCYLLHVLHIII